MECITNFLFCFSALFSILKTSSGVDAYSVQFPSPGKGKPFSPRLAIAANQAIRDGESIVSGGGIFGIFELGFFSPGSSTNRYLGIWYKRSPGTVVWVANREAPLANTSGLLKVNSDGVLLLLSGNNTVIWSSNSSSSGKNINPVAQLSDTGNLVIRDQSSSSLENFIWQSFDFPGDTLLPGMKIGKDLVTGIERNLTSWKSLDDPSPGEYTIWMDINGYPQLFERNGSVLKSRLFGRMPPLEPNQTYTNDLVFNQKEICYKYELIDSSTSAVLRMTLNPDGSFQCLNWMDRRQDWSLYLTPANDSCARYGMCGAYARCNLYLQNRSYPACECLDGFEQKHPEQWAVGDYSSGCRQRKTLDCENGDDFRQFSGMKLPDTTQSWFNESMTFPECVTACQKNCSCTAYGKSDIIGEGSGCLLWFGDLIDVRIYPENGQDIYIRMPASEGKTTTLNCENGYGFRKVVGVSLPNTRHSLLNKSMTHSECERACQNNCSCTAYGNEDIQGGGSGCLLWFGDPNDVIMNSENGHDLYVRIAKNQEHQSGSNKKKGVIKVTLSTLGGVVVLGLTLTVYAWRKKKRSHLKREGQALETYYSNENKKEDLELPFFSLSEIAKATNNFSIINKLGEGGFGPVYKGVLEKEQEIAVKRLSRTSRQGLEEFRNEVTCIAKLQHRNLVKLLGYCIQGDERMLIYEYMPNKSLDSFIFDETKSSLLDWPQRFHIIHGIARGLLYLHQDSRLRIVHRDLKAGNILLDVDMNPKISDFGLARMFGGCETEANTNKVVGTYGYISPEYAVNGLFSVKSDVFSFGVLVLEIVTGKKNRGFSHQDHHDNLLGHAWRLYKEGKSLELIAAPLSDSRSVAEVLRTIHIGLLCVQQHAEDRPSMSSVVLMLGGEGALPPPKQPGFFTGRSLPEVDTISTKPTSISVNEVTITLLDAR